MNNKEYKIKMYEIIKYNILIISVLFLIEEDPIKVIIDYILIVVNIALLLMFNTNSNIDISFISYVLIIINGSALAILFAIIIMVTPTETGKSKKGLNSEWQNSYILKNTFILPNINTIKIKRQSNTHWSINKKWYITIMISLIIYLYYSYRVSNNNTIWLGWIESNDYNIFKWDIDQNMESKNYFDLGINILGILYKEIFDISLIGNISNIIIIIFLLLVPLIGILFIII